ncbi:MAG: NUDIX hydrolase [Clostridia bacterium]|nr:NUDIX hydrolase [Clostridia bacterium]
MIFEEKFISSETIYEGAILDVRRDRVTAPKGEAFREIVGHNGAVAMVAVTDDNRVIMERQYRYACRRVVLEIPAGKIDKGETDPEAAARRELKEETGYTADTFIHLGSCNPSCAYSEEVIHIYLVKGLKPGEQKLDEDEALEVFEMPFEELYAMAERGEIADAKTLAALLMARPHIQSPESR